MSLTSINHPTADAQQTRPKSPNQTPAAAEMSRWHKSTCREPVVHPRNTIPFCSTCGESAVWNTAPGKAPGKAPGIPPLPKPLKDGKFQLRWPSSVSYADSNDDDGSLDVANSSPDVSFGRSHTATVLPGLQEGNIPTPNPQAEPEAAPAPLCSPSQTVYAPLSKNRVKEIRLLRLLKGSLDDPIYGELAIAPLQDQMAFTALSYTWADEDGDSSRSSAIFLGRHWDMFPVTQNCAAALHRMRLHDRDLMVWVDAICIDQGNHVERNHQVGLMTEVYSCAEQVFVYLGDGQLEITSMLTKVRWPKERLSITLAAAQRFFSLAYFSRIWVVQEVANAKSVTVHYGSRSIDWTALQLVPSFANPLPGWIKAEYSKSKPSWQDFAQLLLDTSTSTHASDPRDSVFALFGLAKDCASQGLVADYQLTLPEVYIGAAAFAILNLGDKRILRHAVGRNADGIPTWVPAWGKAGRSPTDEFFQVRAEELLLPAAAAAHPTNCVCDTWGNVSISRHLGAIKIFATTVLDLGYFNLYWVLGHPHPTWGTRRSLQLDYTVVVRVNEADILPTGRLVLLHGSNSIFHVVEGKCPGERIQVSGCCDIDIWRRVPRSWTLSSQVTSTHHGIAANATQVLESVPKRLTSTKLKQMLRVEQEIRDYVQKYRPSLSLPQTQSRTQSDEAMLETIYSPTSAPDFKVDQSGDVKYTRVIPAQVEVGINPNLQAHLNFWATCQFWDLFEELRMQSRAEEEASKSKQYASGHFRRCWNFEIWHLQSLFSRWIVQGFAMTEKRKALSTLPLEGELLYELTRWAQDAKHFESYLPVRLVCPPSTGALDLQVGKIKFPIADFSHQRDHLAEIREIWPDFEPWPGMSGTSPSDVKPQVPEALDKFKRCVCAALEEAHATSVKPGLLDLEAARLVFDEEYARVHKKREADRDQYLREMDDLKAVFSMCSFLRALVPQERAWEEIEIC